MKKLFAIAFTCVYLTLAVGVVQTTHYCMGRVKSQTLFTFDPVKCPCYLFATDGKGKCCKDRHEVIKIEDDHSGVVALSIAPDFFEIGVVFNQRAQAEEKQDKDAVFADSPPPPPPIPLFTKHCSLIFYDSMMG